MSEGVWGLKSVSWGSDLVVFGGSSKSGYYSSSVYKFFAENGTVKLEKMRPTFKTARQDFVAMMIPDHLVE